MELNIPDCLPKESWFRDWLDMWPTAESARSFLLFSGMAMLGACLGRRVWMDQDIHVVRPMLNLLFIGPSGIGKSTAIRISRRLLPAVDPKTQPQFIEGGSTKEKLHRDLSDNPRAILFASELAAFFSKEKYKENLIPYVTQLLDYEDAVELRTIKDHIITVTEPAVSIIGGSTLEWLQEQLPDAAVSGGFLARFLILNEEAKGKRVANPQRLLTITQKKRLHEFREHKFREFAELAQMSGEVDYEDHEAAETYASWYNKYQPEVGYLAPFAARAGEFVLRLSILVATSCHRRTIHTEDILCALHLYEYVASRLKAVILPESQALAAEKMVQILDDGATFGEVSRFLEESGIKLSVDEILEAPNLNELFQFRKGNLIRR